MKTISFSSTFTIIFKFLWIRFQKFDEVRTKLFQKKTNQKTLKIRLKKLVAHFLSIYSVSKYISEIKRITIFVTLVKWTYPNITLATRHFISFLSGNFLKI